MKNRHVLITGGMGFIGHALAKLYLQDRFKVTIIDNLTSHYSHAALTKYRMEELDNKNLNFIQLNCNLRYSLSEKLSGSSPRSIIHLASYPNQAAVQNDKFGAASSMTTNTLVMAELAHELGSRFVYTSSSMAYGDFTRIPMPETETLKPINLYGILKAQGEDIAKFACANTVIVRPSAVYGPGDNVNRVLGRWISEQLNDRPIAITNPSALLDFTHIDDLVKGIKLAEENGVAGQAYNLTRGRACSLSEAALLIQKITNSRGGINISEEIPTNEPMRGALDISKAKEIGYFPKINLDAGIRNYVDWMRRYSHVY